MDLKPDHSVGIIDRLTSAFVTCRACGGSGSSPLVGVDGEQAECPHCWGTGNVLRDSSDGCPR